MLTNHPLRNLNFELISFIKTAGQFRNLLDGCDGGIRPEINEPISLTDLMNQTKQLVLTLSSDVNCIYNVMYGQFTSEMELMVKQATDVRKIKEECELDYLFIATINLIIRLKKLTNLLLNLQNKPVKQVPDFYTLYDSFNCISKSILVIIPNLIEEDILNLYEQMVEFTDMVNAPIFTGDTDCHAQYLAARNKPVSKVKPRIIKKK